MWALRTVLPSSANTRRYSRTGISTGAGHQPAPPSLRRLAARKGRTDDKAGNASRMEDLAVDSREAWTEASARRALVRAFERIGQPTREPELIRLGSNAVFRVDADTIARVAPSLARLPNAT